MADLYSAFGITGVTSAYLDPSGRLYIQQEDEGGGNFSTRIYKDAACTSLVGYTANYSTTGAKAITQNGGSGLGGTVTVETVQATSTAVILNYWRYAIVSAITSSLLTVQGPDLDEGTITEMWRAPTTHVVQMPLFLPGSYAEDSSASALWNIAKMKMLWLQGRAHLCRIGVTASAKNATAAPRINVYVNSALASAKNSGEGIEIGTAGTLEYDDALTAANVVAEYGDRIEVAVTETQASADDTDLTVLTQWVVE